MIEYLIWSHMIKCSQIALSLTYGQHKVRYAKLDVSRYPHLHHCIGYEFLNKLDFLCESKK